MTRHNKLKIAILTMIASQTPYAITLSPIQIQSGSGSLLYAEMKFTQAKPNEKIEVSLATPDDLASLGASHQPPEHLNFFTRRSGDGTGVIVITSSRPILESELNILLKIKEGNATHIQQIKKTLKQNRQAPPAISTTSHQEKPLTPQVIVSEKDIALNLPTSTRFTPPAIPSHSSTVPTPTTTAPKSTHDGSMPLAISIISAAELPALKNNTNNSAQYPVNQPQPVNQPKKDDNATSANSATQVPPSTQVVKPIEPTKPLAPAETLPAIVQSAPTVATAKPEKSAEQSSPKPSNSAPTATQPTPQPKNPITTNSEQYIVRSNESLWKIAGRISSQTHQPIADVMRQIKANNEHAFIQGDPNRIRQGVALNLAAGHSPAPTPKIMNKNIAQQAAVPPGKAKYKLNQAEMKIIAAQEPDSAQGVAEKNNSKNQTSKELSTKVMTAREKTVKLQKNVTQLNIGLQQKDHRIQLLNARLAQLQQKLQQQNHAKKSNSKS